MGLVVLAQVIRELIVEGEYLVECIEHRDHGKVAVSFALRSRAQPYNIQIETMDNKLGGLFRALSDEKPSQGEKPPLVKVGSQPVPVVEVDSVPADVSRARKRRRQGVNGADSSSPLEPMKATTRRRRSAQQLALVPQESLKGPGSALGPSKRRRTARAGQLDEVP
jgi:hypothetical protein